MGWRKEMAVALRTGNAAVMSSGWRRVVEGRLAEVEQ